MDKDQDGNEITPLGKTIAGLLLTVLTVVFSLVIIGYWPDRLPTPRESIKPLYKFKWFHVRLVGIPDSARFSEQNGVIAEKTGRVADSTATSADSALANKASEKSSIDEGNDTPSDKSSNPAKPTNSTVYPPEDTLIHINTLLLLLVAAGGFLGNLIYIATSFTTYVGSGKYRRSWQLWYLVKPFTASGLSISIYFVLRGGFLNMSDDTTNINLYGVMTLSLLAGLFTDRTTLKLKEVFDVLLRPQEERPDSLDENEFKITDVNPKTLTKDAVNSISIVGSNLTKKSFTIAIEGNLIPNPDIKPQAVVFPFTIPDELKQKTELQLLVSEVKGEELFKASLQVS